MRSTSPIIENLRVRLDCAERGRDCNMTVTIVWESDGFCGKQIHKIFETSGLAVEYMRKHEFGQRMVCEDRKVEMLAEKLAKRLGAHDPDGRAQYLAEEELIDYLDGGGGGNVK
jgi:hypothetical protein